MKQDDVDNVKLLGFIFGLLLYHVLFWCVVYFFIHRFIEGVIAIMRFFF